jgi:hypothetical protein
VLAGSACDSATAGVDGYESLQEQILIFPNPSSGKFNIRMPLFIQNANIKIIDTQGRVVYQRNYSDGNMIHVTIPEGIYSLIIETPKNIFSRKISIDLDK